jgi:hypothetical protein
VLARTSSNVWDWAGSQLVAAESTNPQLSDVFRIPYGNKNLVVSPDGCFIPR